MTATLLITTALNPGKGIPYLALPACAKRTLATRAAALAWAVESAVDRIVIADATGQSVLTQDELDLIESNGVEVEQIAYEQSADEVAVRGKGYAEGALIEFALRHSQLLASEPGFFKVTGKLTCRNFAGIRDAVENEGLTRVFWHDCRDGLQPTSAVDCRFFYCSRDYFQQELAHAYASASDAEGLILENALVPYLDGTCLTGRFGRPLLSGLRGGFDTPYADYSLGELDRHFPVWYSKE